MLPNKSLQPTSQSVRGTLRAAAELGRWTSMSIRMAIALLAASMPSMAGGTLGTHELVPLLSQKPAVYSALKAAFSLSDSAFAEIRFGDMYPHLEGARLGPYYIEATAKQSGEKIEIVLCTKPTFLDERGKSLTGFKQERAVSVVEKLTTVMLRESLAESVAECP